MESTKQKQIRETGRKLFWKYGIRRVSIEEICEEANISKGTFYKYFKNKDELLKYIFDFLFNETKEKYNASMNQDIPFQNKIEKILELKLDLAKEMSPEFFQDFYKNASPEILQHVDSHTQKNLKLFLDDFKKAQKKGEIRKNVNPQFMMYFINQMIQMMRQDDLIAIYKTPEALTKGLVEFFFYGIMPKK